MRYPEFLKENETIGIVALSKGVGQKLDSFNQSIEYLQSQQFHILETKNTRNDADPSCDAITRAKELDDLANNKDIKAIWCAAGGDFQIETLPYINFDSIQKNPKWILGASDPTNLLFPVTSKYDIATIYGFNGGAFDTISEYSQACCDFLKGENKKLYSSTLCEHVDFYNDGEPILNTKTEYIGSFTGTGRMLGGCFESINDLAGTQYEDVQAFNNKYKEDGIIWFFDIFSMNSCDVYRALLKMNFMDYFKYTKAILVGRVLFENESELISYQEAFKKACPNIPIVFQMDIGHTYPHFYVINGSIANVDIHDGKGSIEYKLL